MPVDGVKNASRHFGSIQENAPRGRGKLADASMGDGRDGNLPRSMPPVHTAAELQASAARSLRVAVSPPPAGAPSGKPAAWRNCWRGWARERGALTYACLDAY